MEHYGNGSDTPDRHGDRDVQVHRREREDSRPADEFASLFAVLEQPADSATMRSAYVQLAAKVAIARRRAAYFGH